MRRFLWLVSLPALAMAGDLIADWNTKALEAIRVSNTSPPAAARHLAILHVSIFDSVNGIRPTYRPYYVTTTAPRNASAEAAVSSSARLVLLAFYPGLRNAIEAEHQRVMNGIRDGDVAEGIRWGEFVARSILQLRSKDGSDDTATYIPGTQPGQWRPTISFGGVVRPALLPHWGSVLPFALASGTQFRPPAPPALNTSQYAAEVNLMKAIGGTVSPIRTPEQTQIAQFWGYGPGSATPPGHWNQIAQAVVRAGNQGSAAAVSDNLRRDHLAATARLFALLNVAMADAAIVSWDCKYTYNYWRPITAIQEADTDGNPATAPDASWLPLLATPPFPEYTSGHSSFSGAAAVVLAYFFGSDKVGFSVGSDDLPGVQRSYESFSQAALESGVSRIFGGIHFPSANVYGLSTGSAAGLFVFHKILTPLKR